MTFILMSPEQVRAQLVDARADLFALYTVLYEMLSGRRAFQCDTAAETLTAILREDPPNLGESSTSLLPALDRSRHNDSETDLAVSAGGFARPRGKEGQSPVSLCV